MTVIMHPIEIKSHSFIHSFIENNKTWSEEELTTFAHVLALNEERDKSWVLVTATAAQTGFAKLSDSRSWYLGTIDPRHQKSSPNRLFLPEKSLLYMFGAAAILL